ncbi:nicotinate phosphoribosyltransferase [Treponema sp. OMZ 840]|uniref:nicotinate phosphoribosyltransferase n=1 Tax=Treponema sp. OMZ 840 TaxID=244313 RepID=UPI003D8D9122
MSGTEDKKNKEALSALFTDFYELTMAQGYWKCGMNYPAVFDMFFRRQPFDGGFSVFAGIETLIDELTAFSFSESDIAFLDSLGIFEPDFLDYLKTFRFTGDVYAMKEGSIVFPNEPLVRVHADLIQAQIIEGLVLNTLNFQSLIATKSARVWLASKKGSIMEFGLRRAQGSDGAMSASRAAYIGGASSTSNTLAGKRFGIPVTGTMAHSWVMSFPSELEAFEAYADLYPEKSIFLLDTYDTLKSGIHNAVKVGKKLAARGYNFGVRLDSGDIQYLSEEVRKILDNAGFPKATISVSNELTEKIIETLVAGGAPITGWGVGTHMVTGGNESSFTGVYKLAARKNGLDGGFIPAMKFSDNPQKTTDPGIKNVWRLYGADGMMKADIVALEDEIIETGKERRFYHPAIDYRNFSFTPDKAEELLIKRIENGTLTETRKDEKERLKKSRETMQNQLSKLDITHLRILNPHIYKVSITEKLKDLKLKFIQERKI